MHTDLQAALIELLGHHGRLKGRAVRQVEGVGLGGVPAGAAAQRKVCWSTGARTGILTILKQQRTKPFSLITNISAVRCAAMAARWAQQPRSTAAAGAPASRTCSQLETRLPVQPQMVFSHSCVTHLSNWLAHCPLKYTAFTSMRIACRRCRERGRGCNWRDGDADWCDRASIPPSEDRWQRQACRQAALC